MQLALVVGHSSSTVKHPSLDGKKLLIAQPLQADHVSPDGAPLLVVDRLGAGPSDHVIITSDGKAIREMFQVENSPIRWAVMGIADPSQ